MSESAEQRKGFWYATAAYAVWGFFPIYWKALTGVPALQMLSHRIVWSCLALFALVTLTDDWGNVRMALRSRRAIAVYSAAGVAIAVNWGVFIWAVTAGFIVEVSLGYFINPLVSVLFGVVVFREQLRRWQWAAIGLAATGVLYLGILYGSPPWIALVLAASFGTYGLLKKLAPLQAVHGMVLETTVLFLPALLYLLSVDRDGHGAFVHAGALRSFLLAASGPITVVPLLMFASAVRRIPLFLMGMLQFINPTVQFLLGVVLYREPFSRLQFVGFGLVWTALVMFVVEGYVTRRWFPVEEVP